jgi:hypothetical protein
MLNRPEDRIQSCLDHLGRLYERMFGLADRRVKEIISRAARFSLESIARSDALYHDVEHTILVTGAGQAILEGLHLSGRSVSQKEWGHFTGALLFHDIGYVRGICKADHGNRVATGIGDELIELPAHSTDAALSRYHVDRSKMFVMERFGAEFDPQESLNAEIMTAYIEMTRFPFARDERKDTDPLAELARAADLIGQLGDPDRSRKWPSLFREFEEIGLNAKLGYRRPEDLQNDNTLFYRKVVRPHIQKALACLQLTGEGKKWIASLQANVGERVI